MSVQMINCHLVCVVPFPLFSLKAKDVAINAVGIGRKIDESVLQEIAGKHGTVFLVNNFDNLVDQLEEIKKKACESRCTGLVIKKNEVKS